MRCCAGAGPCFTGTGRLCVSAAGNSSHTAPFDARGSYFFVPLDSAHQAGRGRRRQRQINPVEVEVYSVV